MIVLSFPDFPTEVVLSEAVRPTYYKKGDKLTAKLEDNIGIYYNWNDEGLLYDMDKQSLIIKNSKYAGKPKTIVINGNLVWEIPTTARGAKIKAAQVGAIKKFLVNYFISEIVKLDIPINIDRFPVEIHFFYHIKSTNVDEDNLHLFYEKSFRDSIQHLVYDGKKKVRNPIGFIPDDNSKYIDGGYHKILFDEDNTFNKLTIVIV